MRKILSSENKGMSNYFHTQKSEFSTSHISQINLILYSEEKRLQSIDIDTLLVGKFTQSTFSHLNLHKVQHTGGKILINYFFMSLDANQSRTQNDLLLINFKYTILSYSPSNCECLNKIFFHSMHACMCTCAHMYAHIHTVYICVCICKSVYVFRYVCVCS